jgi:DNA-binding response OmpR family regulator
MSKSAHILVVEDNEDIAAAAEAALQKNGYRVTSVNTADDALGAMADEENPIGVIVLDLNLAGERGETLIHRSETLRLPQPSIVITSAEPRTECASALLELGAAACLTKPYSMDDLLEEVRKALEAHPPAFA